MNLPESVQAYLVALNSAAADRVFSVDLPQELVDTGDMQPALTHMLVSETQPVLVVDDGRSGAIQSRVQVTAWAPDPSDAYSLIQSVKDALIGFIGLLGGSGGVNCIAVTLAGGANTKDPTTRLYKPHADFLVLYTV